jgi:A nuclease of the HNH/ENDO VII superfamily with conserved WHH
LENLRAIDNKPGQMYAKTSQYSIELAKRAGEAVLNFRKNESETFDKNQAHGRRYAPEALGGFVQPIVNAPVNIINGLSEPFRAGEKMLFGTQNIPTIPRMEVAERSEYWNKDGRMFANKGAEIGATIVFGGGAGAKALATKSGRALLGVESSYNFASGTYGKDVTQPDANGNPRQMDYLERGGRVFGGVFGARQVVKAEVTAPNSIVNKLDDIFKPKAPQTEAITPEGFRVKVPQTENVKGSNIFEIRRTPKELAVDISLRGERADKYAELVKSNEPWKWNEINKKLTFNEKQAIKELAVEKGLVPKIQVDSKTGFADFSKHVVKEIQLPKNLWNKSDFIQFKWLDKKIGGRPKGHTWHHHQDSGKMQLVEFGVHNITNHTGGRSVWAAGKR